MKTIKELKEQIPIYLEDWKEKADVLDDFKETEISGNILFAVYTYENYTGYAFVLFEKDNELFEVNSFHCSCYGLENQWEPEHTTIELLEHRLTAGSFGKDNQKQNIFNTQLKEFLGV